MTEPVRPLFKTRLGRGRKGPKIVWLHGWGQDHRSLVKLASLFKADLTNVLYDLPGFGKSKMLKPGATTEDYAKALLADWRGDRRAKVLAGHSFGCRVALRLAAMAPERVAGLVLIAAPGLPRKRSLAWRARRLALKALGQAAGLCDRLAGTRLKERFRARFGSRDYRNAGPLRPTLVATVNENLSAVAQSVTAPVLLIYGENDSEVPPELGQKFQNLLAHSKLVVLKGIDHYNVLDRGVYQCEYLIRNFLGEIAAHG